MSYARTRPGFVIAAAILLIIFGSLTLLGGLCLGGAMLLQTALVGQGPNQQEELFENIFAPVDPQVAKEVPSAPYVEGSIIVVNVLLGMAMLTAGVGLLQMNPRARVLGIIVALIDIFLTLAHNVYQAIFIIPIQQRLFDEEMQNLPVEMQGFGRAFQGSIWGGLVFGIVLTLVVWLTVIFMLTHKSVRAAFADDDMPDLPRRDDPRSRHEYDDEDDYGPPPKQPKSPGDTGITER